MARVEASIEIDVPVDVAFAVSQTTGEVRYRWDPFIKSQRLVGSDRPGKGVRTITRSRHGLHMESEYTAFKPPGQVGMRMLDGPWFFKTFAGGWSFRAIDDDRTLATWRYTFSIRPAWLAPIAERIGLVVLQRDIDRRIAGYARGCADPIVVEAAQASLD